MTRAWITDLGVSISLGLIGSFLVYCFGGPAWAQAAVFWIVYIGRPMMAQEALRRGK